MRNCAIDIIIIPHKLLRTVFNMLEFSDDVLSSEAKQYLNYMNYETVQRDGRIINSNL